MKGDCRERFKELKDESVHLTVTSPPYFVAKEYKSGEKDIGDIKEYSAYLEQIKLILKELYRTTCDGGIVCWNTSPILQKGKRIGIPFDTHKIFIELGFEFLEDIVWVKPMGAAKLRCGGWYQNKGKPMTWHANINTEYIMVYKKPGDRPVGEFNDIKKYYPEIPKDLSCNTWTINPETNKTYHEAPFPLEIPKRLILLYSFIGDTVLDPFAGTFTTSKASRDLERNSIGMELNEKYIKQGKEFMGFYQKNLFTDEVYEEI